MPEGPFVMLRFHKEPRRNPPNLQTRPGEMEGDAAAPVSPDSCSPVRVCVHLHVHTDAHVHMHMHRHLLLKRVRSYTHILQKNLGFLWEKTNKMNHIHVKG